MSEPCEHVFEVLCGSDPVEAFVERPAVLKCMRCGAHYHVVEWDDDLGKILQKKLTAESALAAANEKLDAAMKALERPSKRLHEYDHLGIHRSDCAACDLLALLRQPVEGTQREG